MINFSGVTNPADYDRLYAFMHRISNAKIHAAGENAEWEDWKNYESCDGPACAGAVVETTAAPTTAAPTTVAEVVEATVADVVSDAYADAQKEYDFKSNGWTCTETDGYWNCEHEDGGSCGSRAGPEACIDGGSTITIILVSVFLGIPLLLLVYLYCSQPEQVN